MSSQLPKQTFEHRRGTENLPPVQGLIDGKTLMVFSLEPDFKPGDQIVVQSLPPEIFEVDQVSKYPSTGGLKPAHQEIRLRPSN